jgi:hypothetical protein
MQRRHFLLLRSLFIIPVGCARSQGRELVARSNYSRKEEEGRTG